jgi:hypothetical protein
MKTRTKRAALKLGDLVLIEWADACTATHAWQEDIEIAPCVSVGFLVKKDKKQFVIAHTKAFDGQHCGQFAIPRGFVKTYKIVK